MGMTVATECLSEQMTAPKGFFYQLVTITLRLIAEVLGLGPFDRPRVLRVLARIAADLDEITRSPLLPTAGMAERKEDLRAWHRQRLAEPAPKPPRMSVQEEREALGLPPYTRR
jgi:hypothetical protein